MEATTKPVWQGRKPALRDIDWINGPDRKLTYNTYRETTTVHNAMGESYKTECVRFHSTIILTYLPHCEGYRLNSGGWRTYTTKQRLNALLWNAGIVIYQCDHEWFVSTVCGDIPFVDKMLVTTVKF